MSESSRQPVVARVLWVAALVAGVSYCAAAWGQWSGGWTIAWKGAGVGLLAMWAALTVRSRDGWMIAAVLALGAMGDVLLAAVGLAAGVVAFLMGHLVASLLYRRRRQGVLRAPVLAIPAATIGIAIALTHDAGAALYAAALGMMAGTAWGSRFPRRVAWGALLFVLSDLLVLCGRVISAAAPFRPCWCGRPISRARR